MSKFKNTEYLLCLSSFFLPLLFFVFTMPNVVTLEDSGLFLVNGYKLGLAHPPGYPFYTLLSHIASSVPLGSVASRIHLLSALFSAGTCFLFFLILRQFVRSPVALFATLALAVNRIFWGQSVVAEVYALNTVITISVIYFILRFRIEEKNKWLLIAAGIYGLGLANHWPLLGLATPGLLLLVPKSVFKNVTLLVQSLGLSLSGLLFYMYLPLRSSQNSEFTFIGKVESFQQMKEYFLRSYYSNVDSQLAHTWVDGFQFFGYFVWELFYGNLFWVAPLALLGGALFFKRHRQVFFGLLLVLGSVPVLLHFVFFAEFTSLNVNVYRVWLMVPMSICFLFFAIGLEYLVSKLKLQKSLAAPLFLLGISGLAFWGSQFSYLKNDHFAFDYAELTLKSLPKEAVLFVRGDTDVGPISYAQVASGIRPDVKIYNQSGHFFSNRLFDPRVTKNYQKLDLTKKFISQQARLFSTKRLDIFVREKNLPYNFNYNGLFYEVTPLGVAPTPEAEGLENKILEFIGKYGSGREHYHWQFHRDVILAQLCNYLILKGHESHSVFDQVEACWPIKARHFKRLKRYAEAQVYFDRIMDHMDRASLGDKLTYMYDSLENYVGVLNKTIPSASKKAKMIDKKVEYWFPTILSYKRCDNHVVGGLLKLRTQLKIKLPTSKLVTSFSRCKKFKPLFAAIR